ncbi:citrate-proton symporter, partial [Pseudomonas syringae pv. actinidiae ICMP 18807]
AAPGIWLTGAAVLGLIATLVLFRKGGQKLEAPKAAATA